MDRTKSNQLYEYYTGTVKNLEIEAASLMERMVKAQNYGADQPEHKWYSEYKSIKDRYDLLVEEIREYKLCAEKYKPTDGEFSKRLKRLVETQKYGN